MKKRIPGKIGSLYRLVRSMMLNTTPDGVLPLKSEDFNKISGLAVGAIVMITEKRKAAYSGLGSNHGLTDYRVLTTDGEVGWFNGCQNRWFYSDFKLVNANIE